jgi:hypothetical protein
MSMRMLCRVQQSTGATMSRNYLIRLYTACYKAAEQKQQPVTDELMAALAELHNTPPQDRTRHVMNPIARLGRVADMLETDELVLFYGNQTLRAGAQDTIRTGA